MALKMSFQLLPHVIYYDLVAVIKRGLQCSSDCEDQPAIERCMEVKERTNVRSVLYIGS
jgi:hypothetical protein